MWRKSRKLAELAAMKESSAVEASSIAKVSTSTIDKDAKKRERQIRRQLEEIEGKMTALNEQIAVLEEQLCNPAIFSDHEKALNIQNELDTVKSAHEIFEMEWLELSEELENL